jgi:hypothetical protein
LNGSGLKVLFDDFHWGNDGRRMTGDGRKIFFLGRKKIPAAVIASVFTKQSVACVVTDCFELITVLAMTAWNEMENKERE